MATIMRGTDIPITLINLPEGIVIKRLDFAQNGNIVITLYGEDFTIEDNRATAYLSQEETLKLNEKITVEIQLGYTIGGKAQRTFIKSVPAGRILYDGVI